MKDIATKHEYIRLRAEGKSLRKVAEILNLSLSTCRAWENSNKKEILEKKQGVLLELAEAYGVATATRIKSLSDTLLRVDEALSRIDLEQIPPEKLLDVKIKLMTALKSESGIIAQASSAAMEEDRTEALSDIDGRYRAGLITIDQALKEQEYIIATEKASETLKNNAILNALWERLH